MKTTDLLKKQHKLILKILGEIEDTKKSAKQHALCEAVGRELVTHMVIEEQLVYPAIAKAKGKAKGKNGIDINEAYEEHMSVKVALARLLATPPEHEAFHARRKVLHELLRHHIEEEEATLLPRLDARLDSRAQEKLFTSVQDLMRKEMERDPLRRIYGARREARPSLSARRKHGRGQAARAARGSSARAP